MSLDKLGILFLLNYFNQLGTVKDHLLHAVKEVLLAVQASVDIISKSTANTLIGDKTEFLKPVIDKIHALISFTIDKVSPSSDLSLGTSIEEHMQLKENIVNSIISAIDDEIENTYDTHDTKNKLKIEALDTVKQVLQNQTKKVVSSYPSSDSRKPSKPKSAHVA